MKTKLFILTVALSCVFAGNALALTKAEDKVQKGHMAAEYKTNLKKCNDLSGNDKKVCVKDAKAAYAKAKQDAKRASTATDTSKNKTEKMSAVKKDATVAAMNAGAGEALYKRVCQACHAAGVAGAPKFGDKAAWAPRIKTGIDTMTAIAIKGKGAMPPKGGSTATDADIKSAVEYMANAAK
jgi:cytochrome c5